MNIISNTKTIFNRPGLNIKYILQLKSSILKWKYKRKYTIPLYKCKTTVSLTLAKHYVTEEIQYIWTLQKDGIQPSEFICLRAFLRVYVITLHFWRWSLPTIQWHCLIPHKEKMQWIALLSSQLTTTSLLYKFSLHT